MPHHPSPLPLFVPVCAIVAMAGLLMHPEHASGQTSSRSPVESRAHAARLFAAGDRLGALKAWNEVGEPTIDVIDIQGLRRTPPSIVAGQMGLRQGQTLTSGTFLRALHRLEEFPTSTAAVLRYAPRAGGRASVSAFLNERPRAPTRALDWAPVAFRAAFARDIRVDLSALAAQGDNWQPSFRWPHERRRFAMTFALPTPGTLPGIVRIETLVERQTYARPLLDDGRSEEARRRIGGSYSDWITGALRVEAGVATDRIADRSYLALNGGITTRWWGDRVATHLRAERWLGRDNGPEVTATNAMLDWRSTIEDETRWTARVGAASVSDSAPLALWPGAGTSTERMALLRGRQLVRRHVLSGVVFGRRLGFATVERQQPLVRTPYGSLWFAGFVDAAKAWRRLDGAPDSPLHVDVGAGIRIERPRDANQIRIDFGVGVRDGRVRVSADYVTGWGKR